MFSHVTLGMSDLDRTKTFYDALFAAAGGAPGTPSPEGHRLVYFHKNAVLVLTFPINGEQATHANGGTVGFVMDSPEQVEAWHAAGAAAGGTPCEDPPGLRAGFNLYLAYLRDPDGNKLCASYRAG